MKKLIFLAFIGFLTLNCAYIRPKGATDLDSERAAERAAVAFERGNDYFKRKDYSNALIAFEEIVTKYTGTESYEPALYLGAFCQYKLARFKNAVNFGEKYLKEFPNSKYYLNSMSLVGESYFHLNEDYEATYYLTKYYVQAEDSSGRQKAFERILEMLPELSIGELEKLHRIYMAEEIDEHILYHLAQAEAQKGRKEDAERDFNLLMRRFPETRYLYEAEEYKRFISLGEATGRAGILLPLTGKFSNIGQNLLSVVRTFERNKMLPFSLHVLDTKSDPIDATLAAARLVEDLGVDFLIAPVSSFEAFTLCGFAYGKAIPLILPMSTEGRFATIPLVFTQGQSHEDQARMVARYSAYDMGLNRFAVLYPEESHHRSTAQSFAQEVVRNNREVVAMVSFPTDSITIKRELEAIKEKEPGALFLAMDTDMIINAAPQVAYYGLDDITLLGTDAFHSERVPRLGEKYVEGSVFVAPSAIDVTVSRQLESARLPVNEFTARFYTMLLQLRTISNYQRSNLPRLIGETLRGTEILSVYQIEDGEFIKLADIRRGGG
ncbi:MAG: penicillin-binding protein activator [candidate division WOR-3 bacterium]|nr:MAG: penicillin-binding protein activator [candidate division WOR-3 bacterium]